MTRIGDYDDYRAAPDGRSWFGIQIVFTSLALAGSLGLIVKFCN